MFRTPRPTFSLRALLGLVLVVALSLSLVAITVQSLRERSRAAHNLNDLKQIGLGVITYERTFKSLPPAADHDATGQVGCSWRVMVISQLESIHIRRDTTKPWTAPVNAVFRQLAPPAFYCDKSDPNP